MINKPEPKWLEQIYSEMEGEDFLGLRSVQGNITNYLLPGINTVTPRARYYSFYSWLLHEYQAQHPAGMPLSKFIKCREQIFVLANLVFDETDGYGEGTAGLIGSRKLTQVLRDVGERNRIPLNHANDYLGAKHGGYDQFVGVLHSLEIIKESDDETVELDLLPKSKNLASSFEKAISKTEYYKKRHSFDTASFISRDVLLEYGKQCYLSGLAKAPDRKSVLESLFGFDAKHLLPDPESLHPRFGNMSLSLGLTLDILNQTKNEFNEDYFRRCIMYGTCSDFREYRPSPKLNHVLSHWRMFQIREYYVFAIYEIWLFFLDVLRTNGPMSFDQFISTIEGIDISKVASLLKIKKGSSLAKTDLGTLIQALFKQSGCDGMDFEQACTAFTQKYTTVISEEDISKLLLKNDVSREEKLLWAFLMLIFIYLRLKGISKTDQSGSWNWAKEGGARRRSMALFVQQIEEYLREEKSLLDTLEWLFRDYIVAQHTITALEKWQQREVNTFHFSNDNGVYEWNRMDRNSFTASRFYQSYSMLIDLGLVDFDKEDVPGLNAMGVETLRRVKDKISG